MARISSHLQIREKRRPWPTSIATPVVTDFAPVPIEEAAAVPSVVQEEKGGGPPSIEANQLANFAPNEITITDEATPASPDIAELIGANNFEDDLQRADRPPGDTLYVSWNEKLTECLSLAYALYLHVLLDSDKLKRLFEAPYFSESRQRALPKNKEALAALQYVTKPKSEDDRKSASAYATMLIYAKQKGVTARRFPVEMAGVALKEAKTFVRDLSRQNARKRDNAPARPTLTLSYHNGTTHRRHVLTDVSFSTDGERVRLAEQIAEILHGFQD